MLMNGKSCLIPLLQSFLCNTEFNGESLFADFFPELMYPYFVWIVFVKNVSFVAENENKLKELS